MIRYNIPDTVNNQFKSEPRFSSFFKGKCAYSGSRQSICSIYRLRILYFSFTKAMLCKEICNIDFFCHKER